MGNYLRNEVLYLMLRGLAGEGSLRDRLAGVASYMAPRVLGRFEDDAILKEQMLDIYNYLSYVKAGPGDEGDIEATVKRLTDQEARRVADDIVSLVFSEMRR